MSNIIVILCDSSDLQEILISMKKSEPIIEVKEDFHKTFAGIASAKVMQKMLETPPQKASEKISKGPLLICAVCGKPFRDSENVTIVNVKEGNGEEAQANCHVGCIPDSKIEIISVRETITGKKLKERLNPKKATRKRKNIGVRNQIIEAFGDDKILSLDELMERTDYEDRDELSKYLWTMKENGYLESEERGVYKLIKKGDDNG